MHLRKPLIALLTLLLSAQIASSQIKIDSSYNVYELTCNEQNFSLSISFYKDNDSSSLRTLTIKDQTEKGKRPLNLRDEIKIIDSLWKEAERHVPIQLASIHIGYPSLYSDVLKRQITIFSTSKLWQNHIKKNGKKLDVPLMTQIMVKEKTYLQIDSLLGKRGYRIKGISTEKHGFVSKGDLMKAGFTGKEIIPIPFIVYLLVERKN